MRELTRYQASAGRLRPACVREELSLVDELSRGSSRAAGGPVTARLAERVRISAMHQESWSRTACSSASASAGSSTGSAGSVALATALT
jgi:hypothetical protein